MPKVKAFKYIVSFVAGATILLGIAMLVSVVKEATDLPEPWFDDAFMYVRYAENINGGHGCTWNLGLPAAYGCTDIVFTYLIALAKKIAPTASYAKISIWLPIINLLIILPVLIVAVIRFSKPKSNLEVAVICALVLGPIVLNPAIRYHFFTGMDTILSFSANVLLIISFLWLKKNFSIPRLVLAALAAYFSWLVRPDNFFFCTIFPALFLITHFIEKKQELIIYYSVFGGLVVADLAFKYHTFHDILPLPFFVKSSGYYQGYMGEADWNAMSYFIQFLQYSFVWIAISLVFVRRQQLQQYVPFWIPVFLTCMYFFTAVQIMGVSARYYLPALPFLIFPAFEILSQNAFTISTGERLKTIFNKALVSFIVFAALFFYADNISTVFSTHFLENRKPYQFQNQISCSKYFPVVTSDYTDFYDLCKKLPTGTTIAASEVGRLAAYNPHLKIIDLGGLHEPYFAHHGFSAKHLLEQKPSIIQLAHYNITKVNYDIINNPQFRAEYEFYPNLFYLGVAIRKTDTLIYHQFQSEIASLYGIQSPELFVAHYKSNSVAP